MKSNNILQKDLAECLEVTPQNISGILNDKSNLTTEHLVKLSRRYSLLNLRWLLTGEGEMTESGKDNFYLTNQQPKTTLINDEYKTCRLCKEKDKQIEIMGKYIALLEGQGRNRQATSG